MTTSERFPVGLLDTCVLIDLEQLKVTQLPLITKISALTLAELGQGLYAAHNSAERALRLERLQLAEVNFEPLPFTADSARRFTHMVGAVVAAGRNPKPRRLDLMIAAVASVNKLPLFTRNAKDFIGLEQIVTVVAV
ncbi:MAG: type II toxin-antitoxin system VapC family toxin [Candidatus Dormibacteraceae bacterium]